MCESTRLLSLVIPLYHSEPNLPALFRELSALPPRLSVGLEVVFVIDGSPDACSDILARSATGFPFRCRIINLSRNFGSFAAITAGLSRGNGDYFSVLAADLQEPPELVIKFVEQLVRDKADIVFGMRVARADPFPTAIASRLFWAVYRWTINPDIPPGGVDVFACTRQVRDQIIAFKETDSSLIALLFWLGYRRAFVTYERRARTEGRSAWRFRRRLRYAVNTVFNFTDIPIRLLLTAGLVGIVVAVLLAVILLVSRLSGYTRVPGYTPIVLTIVFFGGLTALGLGIVGEYVWLTLQNAKHRPNFLVRSEDDYDNR